jgi:hypothetical protein
MTIGILIISEPANKFCCNLIISVDACECVLISFRSSDLIQIGFMILHNMLQFPITLFSFLVPREIYTTQSNVSRMIRDFLFVIAAMFCKSELQPGSPLAFSVP